MIIKHIYLDYFSVFLLKTKNKNKNIILLDTILIRLHIFIKYS